MDGNVETWNPQTTSCSSNESQTRKIRLLVATNVPFPEEKRRTVSISLKHQISIIYQFE